MEKMEVVATLTVRLKFPKMDMKKLEGQFSSIVAAVVQRRFPGARLDRYYIVEDKRGK